MEFLMNQRLLLMLAITLLLSGCSKDNIPVYLSESVDTRFTESMNWNANHPTNEINVESDDYTIFTMADCHIGTTSNLDKFLNNAHSLKPTAIIIDGDLTGGLSEDYTVFEDHFPKDYVIPSFFLVGNHDLWYNGWSEFYKRFGSSSYTFTVRTSGGTDLFICVDTGGNTLGKLQTEWLTQILQSERSAYRRCIIITHINLFRHRHTESTNLVEEELCSLLNLFTVNKVDMVITGHDHNEFAEEFGVTTYIQVDALEDGLSNAGYMKLEVKNGILGYKFVNVNE